MQALITWPSRAETWIVPQLGCCKLSTQRRRRKKMWGLAFPVCCGTTSAVLIFGLGCGSLATNCELNKGNTFVSAWALEEQDIGDEVSVENSTSENGLLGECGSREVGVEGSDEIDGKSGGGGGGGGGGRGNWEEKSEVVDVRALASRLQFAKTADDVEEVLKDMGDLPLQVFSTMIRGLGRDKLVDSAFAIVEWLKRRSEETDGMVAPNLFIFNSLLGAVKQSKQFGDMEKVLADMRQEGVEPNIVTYNTIMAIYVEQGLSTKALDVLEEIQKKGMIASPVTYSTALQAYQKMQEGIKALEFFVEFREKYRNGEICNVLEEDWESEFQKLESFTKRVCYQVMRRWLVMDENLSINVLKLLVKMDNAGIPLGRAEHERLLWACTREDHYNVAKELYSRIRERHSEISLSVCNHVIWVMGKAKKWWAALEIYEDMLDKGPKPNNMSYELVVSHFNILLTAARKKGIWRWGVRLLNKMEEKGLKPRSKEWNAVLVACSKAAETSAAVKIFRRMVEQGQKPTILSYGALLSALEKGKLYDEARQVWEHMIKVGVKPNLYAYTIMASVFSGHGKFNLVETILQEMVSSGIEPTVVTYNAIISGCARNDSSSADAYDWFDRMKANNIPPNHVTYEMMIEALAKEGKPRLAYELYLRAQNQSIHLSSKAYDTLVQSSVDFGDSFDLNLLGPRPPPHTKENLHSRNSST